MIDCKEAGERNSSTCFLLPCSSQAVAFVRAPDSPFS